MRRCRVTALAPAIGDFVLLAWRRWLRNRCLVSPAEIRAGTPHAGRPIVSTPWQDALAADGPPHLSLGASADELGAAIVAAAAEPAAFAAERRRWATEHTWSARWPAWSAAVFGDRA